MTKDELNEQIRRIELEPNTSADEKKRRIGQLNTFYSEQQRKQADAANQKQQQAEADLKSRLRNGYMANPAASADSFEADYPQLKSEYLRGEALKADSAAQRASAAATHEAF